MLSTVMEIGAIIALIGGVAYFTFQYMPMIIDFWNNIQAVYFSQFSEVCPEWIQPFIAVGAMLSGIGLIVKLL